MELGINVSNNNNYLINHGSTPIEGNNNQTNDSNSDRNDIFNNKIFAFNYSSNGFYEHATNNDKMLFYGSKCSR